MRAALYLNSESPRRQALLGQLGVAFVTISAAIDETWNGVETPACYVERLALEKAQAGWRSIAQRDPLPVLGADTAVVLEGAILGKPGDPTDAVNMLARLSGRRHDVYSAVALVEPPGASHRPRVNVTRVTLREITEWEREAYVATGESFDKAGAYAIQGLAAAFIE
ncbi:MAG: Maf family protein, partial [Gammaproteobacteria bacterium]